MELSEIKELVAEAEAFLWPDYEDALIGVTTSGEVRAVYEWGKCIEVLMLRDGMTYTDAVGFFEYNIVLGKGQPTIVHTGYDPESIPSGCLRVWADEHQ
jgi:hypothetical protein